MAFSEFTHRQIEKLGVYLDGVSNATSVVLVVGILWSCLSRFPFVRLPSDISITRENISFHFPLIKDDVPADVVMVVTEVDQSWRRSESTSGQASLAAISLGLLIVIAVVVSVTTLKWH